MYKQFRADKYFFLKYYVINLIFYSVACTALAFYTGLFSGSYAWLWFLAIVPVILPDFKVIALGGAICTGLFFFFMPFHWWYLLGIPLGAYLGVQSGAWMHNACHGNLKPKWLNRFVGELCGLQQLPGVAGWWVTHIIHHQYPDDPDLDPHPSHGVTYCGFIRNMKVTMRKAMTHNFFNLWGKTKETKRIWAMVDLTLPINRYLRALFMLLLFSPPVFFFVWIPSYLTNITFYAHLNYATHRPNEKGDFEILDVNRSWYYRFMNWMAQGCYFYKTHHWRPHSINPMKMDPTKEDAYVFFVLEGNREAAEKPRVEKAS
ncbi:fatty acid desaturase [Opitutia bacterium ISCC 51]|nr:fatty acid desaturase [Opitutae bacterium ISCC 51]QXD29911.1 fatty acid desaturase [Opitutae bacterium ISCC 52]